MSDDGNLNGDVLDVPNVNDHVVGVVYAAPGSSPPAAAKTASAAVRFDPAEHTVAEVEEYLVKHPDQTDAVLAAEKSGKARATLVGD